MKNLVFKDADQFAIDTAVSYLSGQIVLEGSLGGIAVADAIDEGEGLKVTTRFTGVVEVDAVDGSYAVGDEVEATAAQGSVQALSAGALFGKVIKAVTVSGKDNKVQVKLGL